LSALPITFAPLLADARAHLEALTGEKNPAVTFQTFSDVKPKTGKDRLAGWLHGTLDQHAAELRRRNERGAGVYIMLNSGDGKGRTARNVRAVRAVFTDQDKPRTREYALRPSFIVNTSPGRYQAFWRMADEMPLKDFTPMQERLAAYYGSDASVTDLPRVARLAGFFHMKREPVLVTIEGGPSVEHSYTPDEIRAAHPVKPKAPAPPKPKTTSPRPVAGTRREKLMQIVREKAEGRSWTEGNRHASAKTTAAHGRKLGLEDGDLALVVTDLLLAAGKTEREAEEIVEWTLKNVTPDPEEAERPRPAADAPADAPAARKVTAPENAGEEKSDGAAKRLIKIGEENSLLFHDERETPHAAIGTDDSRRIVSVKSDTFTTFLSGTFYRTTGRAANSEALTAARRVLSHKAVFEGPKHALHNRFAFHDGAAWIDLANEKQEAVKVTGEGWTIERPPILFRRFRRQAALPRPATSGDMKKLSGFLNTREKEDALLALVWPVTAMLGNVPRPVLDFHGPQGSAKTTAGKMLRRLTDPSVAPTSYLSQKDDELALCLESNAVPLFDNVTHISARQGEILCAAVTGAGFSKRELFTDSDEILYSYQRAIIMTGINVATVAPDLLDRFLLLQLDRIDRAARRSEAGLWRAFDAAAPAIFSGMLDTLSSAMRLYQGIAEKTMTLERMADFCLWGAAVSEALGFGADSFFKAYTANVSAQTEEVLEADCVARAVRELVVKRGGWTGTASELLKLFRELHGDETKTDGWPKRADGLSRRVRVLEATLAEVGIAVRWSREGEARTRTLTLQATADRKPNSSSLASGASGTGERTDATDATDAEKGYLSALPVSRLRRSVS